MCYFECVGSCMKLLVFFVCLLLELISGMEVDLFVPSFPLLQACFNLTPFHVELTLGVNLLAYCLASFLASPTAEKYGKKNTIIFGTFIFSLGSVLCSVATKYEWILVGRALQGFGIAAPCVLAYVVIADHYSEEEQIRFLGYMNAAITLGMSFAPILGCFVADACDWRGNFHLLSAFGILAFVATLAFLPKDQGASSQSMFNFRNFIPVLRCPLTLWMATSIVLIGQGYWIFIALSPLLYIEVFNVSLLQFGYYQGALSLSFALVSLLGGHIIRILGNDLSLIYSLRLMLISGVAILFCLFKGASVFWITASMCLHSMGIALPIIILWPKYISMTNTHKTERSSLATAGRLIATASSVQFISFLYDDSLLYIAIAVAIICALCYPICLYTYRLSIAKTNAK
ncbi:MAG: Multidrug resistance protein MdtL [Holosporales bacterium]